MGGAVVITFDRAHLSFHAGIDSALLARAKGNLASLWLVVGLVAAVATEGTNPIRFRLNL